MFPIIDRERVRALLATEIAIASDVTIRRKIIVNQGVAKHDAFPCPQRVMQHRQWKV